MPLLASCDGWWSPFLSPRLALRLRAAIALALLLALLIGRLGAVRIRLAGLGALLRFRLLAAAAALGILRHLAGLAALRLHLQLVQEIRHGVAHAVHHARLVAVLVAALLLPSCLLFWEIP